MGGWSEEADSKMDGMKGVNMPSTIVLHGDPLRWKWDATEFHLRLPLNSSFWSSTVDFETNS